MPAIISGTSGDVRRGGTYTISGSGFESSQSDSQLLLFDSAGGVTSLTAAVWTDTSIQVAIPNNESYPVALGPVTVAVQIQNETLGTRTPTGDAVLMANPNPPTDYDSTMLVLLQGGTQSGADQSTASMVGTSAIRASMDVSAAFLDVYSKRFSGSGHAEPLLSTPYAFERTDGFSIAFWYVIPMGIGGGPYPVLSNRIGDSLSSGYDVIITASQHVSFVLGGSTDEISIETTAAFSTSNWHYVVVTYDGSSSSAGMEIYVDSALQTVTRAGTLTSTTVSALPLRIGSKSYATMAQFFVGYLDEMAIYDTEMAAITVTATYNAGAPTDLTDATGLQSWWRMGDGDTSPTIIDHGPLWPDGNLTEIDMLTGFTAYSPTGGSPPPEA